MSAGASTARARRVAVLLAFGCTTTVARAQETAAVLPTRLTPSVRVAIERLADSLTAEHLPSTALIDRAAEGLLKGADDARVLAAVRALAARIRQSRVILGAQARDDELLASASALFSGVPVTAIARLAGAQRKQREPASLAIPLAVVAELAMQRLPMDLLVSSVEALLVSGASNADVSAFRNATELDLKRGRSPRDAISAGVRSTMNGIRRTP